MIATKFRPIIILVALIWSVEAMNLFIGHGLVSWGIFPRSLGGLIGIPFAPLIHGGLWHTISNTVPLLFLGALILTGGKRVFWETTITVALLSGALVWLFARSSYHVGASGLVFGYFGAILARGAIERNLTSIALAIITGVVYGGLIWGVLPLRSHVSFESHLFGLIAGIIVVWLDVKFGRSKQPS